ncbi:MAG: hypothetical protein JSW50_09215 [Candidatus Latescibacterota bacterium]|nr:MAG: hypothetical protein JSW50_09215 [Candidatus Latescibacterota bacterium]
MPGVPHFDDAKVKDALKRFIIDNFPLDGKQNGLGDNDSFLEQGIIDSTGVLELVSLSKRPSICGCWMKS